MAVDIPDLITIRLEGDLDVSRYPEFRGAFIDRIGTAGPVLVDLSAATLVDSTFLSELLLFARRVRDQRRQIAVLITHPLVARTFSLANVSERFEIHGNRDDAIRSLQRA
ncbi:MAG TPA: STAS domain-containing protein [Candidatus Acidoferrum sp.]|nr:STAS domain-containing protein [Candidatus Acidoferrum sp.]